MAVVSRSAAQAEADTVKNETVAGANTAARVGGLFRDLTDSVAFGSDTTPLNALKVGDAASSASSPTGAFSGSMAYTNLQAMVTALTGGGQIILVPGTYGGTTSIVGKNLAITGQGHPNGGGSSAVLISGNLNLDGTSSCTLTLANVSCSAPINDSGTHAQVEHRDCIQSGAVTITQALRARNTSYTSTVSCTSLTASDSTFSAAVTIAGAVTAKDCTFQNTVTCTGGGTSEVDHCTFSGNVLFDQAHVSNSTFSAGIDGDGSGGIKITNSVLTGSTNVPLSWDSTTELRALKAGFNINNAGFVLALSTGQGGDADVQTSTTVNLNFSGNPRSIYGATAIGSNGTCNFLATGGVAGQKTLYCIDYYTTGHNVAVTFNTSTPLVTMTAQTAGKGTRYWFGLDAGASAVTFMFSETL